MKLSLKILHHQGNKISFAHQVLILDFCRNLAAHCHIVIVKMYSRTLAYNYAICGRELWDEKDLFSRAASPLSALKHTKNASYQAS